VIRKNKNKKKIFKIWRIWVFFFPLRFGENSAPVKERLGGKGREGKWVVFIGGNIFGFLGGCRLCTSVKPVGFWNGTNCKKYTSSRI
jgi:hypothetical protein